jgi:hypothetical protein
MCYDENSNIFLMSPHEFSIYYSLQGFRGCKGNTSSYMENLPHLYCTYVLI